jgi:hypothetical protein
MVRLEELGAGDLVRLIGESETVARSWHQPPPTPAMIYTPSGKGMILDPTGRMEQHTGYVRSEPKTQSTAHLFLYNPTVARLVRLFRAIERQDSEGIVGLVKDLPESHLRLAVRYSVEVGKVGSLRVLMPEGQDLRPCEPSDGFLRAALHSCNPAMAKLLADEGLLAGADQALVIAMWKAASASFHGGGQPGGDPDRCLSFASVLIEAGAGVNRPFPYEITRSSYGPGLGVERLSFPPMTALEILIAGFLFRASAFEPAHFETPAYASLETLQQGLPDRPASVQRVFHLLIARGARTKRFAPTEYEMERSRVASVQQPPRPARREPGESKPESPTERGRPELGSRSTLISLAALVVLSGLCICSAAVLFLWS